MKHQEVLVKNGGRQDLIKADTVVIASGATSNRELIDEIANLGINVRKIGDCTQVQKLPEAVEDAFITANEI